MYISSNTAVTKLKKKKRTWHVALMRKVGSAYRILIESPEEQRSLERHRGLADNIKIDLPNVSDNLY
jgi:hypothetical protein